MVFCFHLTIRPGLRYNPCSLCALYHRVVGIPTKVLSSSGMTRILGLAVQCRVFSQADSLLCRRLNCGSEKSRTCRIHIAQLSRVAAFTAARIPYNRSPSGTVPVFVIPVPVPPGYRPRSFRYSCFKPVRAVRTWYTILLQRTHP